MALNFVDFSKHVNKVKFDSEKRKSDFKVIEAVSAEKVARFNSVDEVYCDSRRRRLASTRGERKNEAANVMLFDTQSEELAEEVNPTDGCMSYDSDSNDDNVEAAEGMSEEQQQMLEEINGLLKKAFKLEGMESSFKGNVEFDTDNHDEEVEQCSYVQFPQDCDASAEDSPQRKEENIEEEKLREPLYKGAMLTLGISFLLLAAFTMRHKLSSEALGDFIVLLNFLLPSDSKFPKSLYLFKKFFHDWKASIVFHHYCSYCLVYLDEDHGKCPNLFCNKDLTIDGAKAFFIEVPIPDQLKTLLARPGFYGHLSHRFKREKAPGAINDVYDGVLYKRNYNILSNQDNISLTMNTDGVPVFKSSKVSIWPLYFIINELPYKERIKRKNMLLAGLWFGPTKGSMATFLQPFHKSLVDLGQKGCKVYSPERGEFICKVLLLACTCDLPAKCTVMNTTQFNGYYGCPSCLQPGLTVKTGMRGSVHAFEFQRADPKGPCRTATETLEQAKKALDEGQAEKGVKGPSWLMGIPSFDFIRGMAIDYMHGACLGVMKMLMKLWFQNDHARNAYSIADRTTEVNDRLSSFKPPFELSRLSKSLDHFTQWKASEYRSFLLFYGLPLLYGILPAAYFIHFAAFSEAIFLLSKEQITEADVQQADRLLQYFCFMFDQLYELRYMTINVHQLLHMTQCVRDLGPLWVYSCFHFEDKNGFLLKLFHGTQSFQFQVVYATSVMRHLFNSEHLLAAYSNGKVELLFKKLIGKTPLTMHKISNSSYLVGSVEFKELSTSQHKALCDYLGYFIAKGSQMKSFARLFRNHELIHSQSYTKVVSRNSYTISYQTGDTVSYGQVIFYFEFIRNCNGTGACLFNCQCEATYMAFITPLDLCEWSGPYPVTDWTSGVTCRNFVPVKRDECTVLVIPLENIITKCVFIEYKDQENNSLSFCCSFPNRLERD